MAFSAEDATKFFDPVRGEKYVTEHGALTLEGVKMIQQMIIGLRELQSVAEDHETRIEALEP